MSQLRSPGNHLLHSLKTEKGKFLYNPVKVSNIQMLMELVLRQVCPYFLCGHSAKLLHAFISLLDTCLRWLPCSDTSDMSKQVNYIWASPMQFVQLSVKAQTCCNFCIRPFGLRWFWLWLHVTWYFWNNLEPVLSRITVNAVLSSKIPIRVLHVFFNFYRSTQTTFKICFAHLSNSINFYVIGPIWPISKVMLTQYALVWK